MMTNKSIAYMIVAMVIGYTLISTVPVQISMYATPQKMLSYESSEDGESNTSEQTEDVVHEKLPPNEDEILESSEALDSTAGESSADTAEVTKDVSGSLQSLGIVSWYALDALIAAGVYLIAKRRFG